MKRGVVLVWLMAMLLAVMVAVWPAESRRSTEPVLLRAIVDGGTEEHQPRLATTVEAPEEGISTLRRGVLDEIGEQQVESIRRPRVCTVRRTARGPPMERRRRGARRRVSRKEKTC
jgi:hypothetical protein